MANNYDNTNSGMLTRNDNKQANNHPDYRGSINVNGEEYWLSGWIKSGREGTKLAGKKYFSLSVTPKESRVPEQRPSVHRGAPQRPRPSHSHEESEFDDDVPF